MVPAVPGLRAGLREGLSDPHRHRLRQGRHRGRGWLGRSLQHHVDPDPHGVPRRHHRLLTAGRPERAAARAGHHGRPRSRHGRRPCADRRPPDRRGRSVRLVVVGGVAGGMSAAARARRLDESAEIIVLERGDYVSFANCGLPYFVGGEITEESSLLVQTPQSLADALNLDVRVRHDVVGLDAGAKTATVTVGGETETISYDALVLSPGAAAIKPPLPGIDSARVQTLRTVGDAVAMREAVLDGATNAVVLGAGFIGIEAAEALALRGIATTLVELAPHVLPPLESEMARMATEELRRLGIDVREVVAASEVIHGEASDTVVLADGTRLDADIIVLSAVSYTHLRAHETDSYLVC